jgi:hypothetical protein
MLSSIFRVEELSVGVPICLRWHGWRVDRTIADTASGWVENTFDFENTRNANGLGKVLGALMDVGGDLLHIASRMFGTVSPVFFRSDAREERVRKNVMHAIAENEKSFSGSPDWESKQLLANMLYLDKMLPIVTQNGDRALARKISNHIAKYGVAYEVFASKRARAQSDQAGEQLPLLEIRINNHYEKIVSLEAKIENGADLSSIEQMELYNARADYQELSFQYQFLELMRSDASRRASEAYVYLSATAEQEAGSLRGEAETEIRSIQDFLKSDPAQIPMLDSMVEEMKDARKQDSLIMSSMGVLLSALQKANGDYAAVQKSAEGDSGLQDAISLLNKVKEHALCSSIYSAYMADAFSYGKSGNALAAKQAIEGTLAFAIKYMDKITDYIKSGEDYKKDIKPMLVSLSSQLGILSTLSSFFPVEYSQSYSNRLDRELKWIMDKLPNNPAKKSIEKSNAAAQNFELAFVIFSSGVLSPNGVSDANRALQRIWDGKGGEFYNQLYEGLVEEYK